MAGLVALDEGERLLVGIPHEKQGAVSSTVHGDGPDPVGGSLCIPLGRKAQGALGGEPEIARSRPTIKKRREGVSGLSDQAQKRKKRKPKRRDANESLWFR